MLGLCAVELKQTRFYQEVFAEGRAEGLVWGETRVLKRLLTRRFGSLPAWAAAELAAAEPAQLEAWAEPRTAVGERETASANTLKTMSPL